MKFREREKTNLQRQFSCRGEDERNRALARCQLPLVGDVGDERPNVRGRLARARLGNSDEIAPRHGRGYGLRLDGRGRRELLLTNRRHRRLVEAEMSKARDWFRRQGTRHLQMETFN